MDVRGEAGAGSHQAALPGQLYVDDVLELVAGDERQEHVVQLRERGRATLDDDRRAA